MFELSPLVTAASAEASWARASSRSSRSKPEPTMVVPGQSAGSRRNALALRSMMATEWPCAVSSTPEPGADPAAADDDDVHGHHATRIGTPAQLIGSGVRTRRPSRTVIRHRAVAVRAAGHALMRAWSPRSPRTASPSRARRRRSRRWTGPRRRHRRRRPARRPLRSVKVDLPESLRYRLKNVLLGPPLVNEKLSDERLGRPSALGVLAPDCISSSAYGTEEMLTQLIPFVGLAGFVLVVPVTMAILGVLFFVTLSYLDVIAFYTKAGGAYVVARENFGPKVAQIAAVALLIDYTVTVAVQTAAGTAALTSAVPQLPAVHGDRSPSGVILLLLYGNLRGIREAGRFFAFPTYFFIFSLGSSWSPGTSARLMGTLHAHAIPGCVHGGQPADRSFGHPGSGVCSTGPPSSSSCGPSPTAGRR